MSQSLIDKIRRARETRVEIDGHAFTIRRPTDEEALRIGRDGMDMLDVVKRYTVGWDLAEIDVVPGGNDQKLPFDADLFAEWVSDQPAVWEPLADAIMQAYKAHADKRSESAKN